MGLLNYDESPVDIAEKSWARMSFVQKKAMLKNMGYHQSFAKTKSLSELVSRGGGHVASWLLKTVNLWKQKNPHRAIRLE